MYDQVATSSITLTNSGKVGFQFSAINMDPALQKRPLPGQPVMVPHSVSLRAFFMIYVYVVVGQNKSSCAGLSTNKKRSVRQER